MYLDCCGCAVRDDATSATEFPDQTKVTQILLCLKFVFLGM